ncbi:hypothetical protein VTL71DRAFT_15146 [Oculimacula yallundae]|uniref:Uncharacterized protein n=1 Tax=Oculimacula yallundae TaxID=86028 RepID=A0ABR4CFR0_9HELO
MDPPELSARLRYLNHSAHLLATTSPATSRYLMSRHNALIYDSKIELSEAQKRKACGACGTIMILGWEATLEGEERSKKRNTQKKLEVENQPRAMVYTCATCSKKTRFLTGISKPARRIRTAMNSQPISSHPAPQSQSQTSDTKAPLKTGAKRKSRKKGVLDAILAKNQATKALSSGFGLDLSDFMKKS